MPSRPSDRLPNEVLLHVFIKGVEDDRNDDRRSCRRLKAFACLARQVCARWRTIIDKAPSSVSFWIAYLVLTPHQLPGRGGQSFAKQLATFHHLLLSSNGCDLAISFNLGGLSPGMARGILNPYTTAMLRLASYAMERIIPYHDRVIELDVFHAAPEVYTYLLRLVATCWTNTSRLLAVTFRGITNTPAELSLSSLLGYKKILPETSKGVSSSLSLAHFCNLDTLTIPAGLWKQGLLLPPNLQHLNLTVSNDATLTKLFTFLQTQMNSFESLQSIRIQNVRDAKAEEIDDQEQARRLRPTWQSLGQINLPLLNRISLQGFLVGDVLGFLQICSCQSLESLSIKLRGCEEIDQSSLSIDFPSKFPWLTSTKLELNVGSWQSLHYLEIFTSLPIQWLEVSFDKYEPEWIVHLDWFRIDLSKLRLHKFSVDASYWVSHYLLASLDTQNLTGLDIDAWLDLGPEPPMDLDSEILAPHLIWLRFTGSGDHFIHFLSHLKATQLVDFEYISDESESPDWDLEKVLQMLSTKLFASVWSADLNLCLYPFNEFLPHVVHLFPNLDRLRIRIWSGDDDVVDDDVIPHLIREAIQPLCDTLAPTTTPVPFPQLCSLTGECMFYGGESQSTALKWSDITREEVRRMLQEMLTSRAKGGGLPLQMKPIKFEEFEDNTLKEIDLNVKFEACKALPVIETNSPRIIRE